MHEDRRALEVSMAKRDVRREFVATYGACPRSALQRTRRVIGVRCCGEARSAREVHHYGAHKVILCFRVFMLCLFSFFCALVVWGD